MFNQVLPQLWMLVPRDERQRIAEVFNLSKTGISEIRDQEVISDGYSATDLAGITSEGMTAYVGSEEAFPRLWELTVAKARSEVHPPEPLPVAEPLPAKPTSHAKGKPKTK